MRTALAIQLVDVHSMWVAVHVYYSLLLEVGVVVLGRKVQFLAEQGGLEHHRCSHVPVLFALCLAIHVYAS